ncbi:hypothetical protein CON36_36330 [Bacillus cereus]|uniref:Uncharacterized protein n=1 Tax=Bacillus cereus TaxID=1396 RepID=A0A9X6SRT0_BACCE|nr:hypothetical protein [Bacillus cereus]PDZ93972.1 hypothetical protein CON36_36330 [Bacillus cereus]
MKINSIKDIQTNLKEMISQKKEMFFQEIFNKATYLFMYEYKQVIADDSTPEQSGMVVNSSNKHKLDDYKTFGDFAKVIFTGGTIATHVKGSGLAHEKLNQKLEHECLKMVGFTLNELLAGIGRDTLIAIFTNEEYLTSEDDIEKLTIEDIKDIMCENDLIDVYGIRNDMIEELMGIEFSSVIDKGVWEAGKQRQQELDEIKKKTKLKQ